jgi:aminoglycoside phosphotransferase (APT) family kinase protein
LAHAGGDGSDAALRSCADDLPRIRPEQGAGAQRELAALRGVAARLVRHLADLAGETTDASRRKALQDSVATLGRDDACWVRDFDAACSALAKDRPAGDSRAHDSAEAVQVTAERITQYLRRRFPASPDAVATEVVPIPGGRSKKTFLVSVAGAGPLSGDLVMRQDYALKYAGTKVEQEYRPLQALAALGLPVPRPLHLEPDVSELGPPFLFVNRLRGKPPGTYFGMSVASPGAFRDLAATLARLHRVEPVALGMTAEATGDDVLRRTIQQYQRKWRENATLASPIVDYAYSWALQECARDPGTTTVVHGDAGPYNLLVENDRLEAVLDWEFAHVGDPAEDLGIARIYAEGFMPWSDFLRIYAEGGGPVVPESRVRLGMLIQFLKGTTLVAASGRNFREGGTTEFIKGASSFTGLRMIELRIADLLKRFEAL